MLAREPDAALKRTPLHALHVACGGKMVPFAGYAMPVSYPQGILAEHRQCRESAVLFAPGAPNPQCSSTTTSASSSSAASSRSEW